VEKEAAQRAIVGLTMGGGPLLTVGLGNLDCFAWVGAFSAAPTDEKIADAILADVPATNARLRLLWTGCGKDNFLIARNEQFIGKLKDGAIKHEWHLTEAPTRGPLGAVISSNSCR
jgi:hypothetical protein